MTVIEKMARAIIRSNLGAGASEREIAEVCNSLYFDMAEDAARAALSALEEPSEAQIGQALNLQLTAGYQSQLSEQARVRSIYKAMIRAAKEES